MDYNGRKNVILFKHKETVKLPEKKKITEKHSTQKQK